jgi:hypothetical protein
MVVWVGIARSIHLWCGVAMSRSEIAERKITAANKPSAAQG